MDDHGYVTRVDEVHHRTPRSVARHAALDAFAMADTLTGRTRSLRRPRVQHLFLHHVFDDEVDGFVRLLDDLARDHTFIGYGESIDRIVEDRIDAPYLALSFDDGLESCLRAGRILHERGISACFFVVSTMMDERDPDRIARFCRDQLAMPPTRFLDWDGVGELAELGHEIGSHTATHARLSSLDLGGIRAELEVSRHTIARHVPVVRHFAWPYGHESDVPGSITALARAAGFETCAANIRGAHTVASAPDDLCVRRDHILANWPVRHIRYFLARNARASSAATNRLPTADPVHR